MFDYQTIPSTGQKYHLSGNQPRIFILSGTHGDEFGVVPLVENAVNKYAPQLPSFLYIPILSPTAIGQKTRKNCHNVDLNRSFREGTDLPEAKETMNLLRPFKFDLVLNFHEDIILSDFYFYDTDNLEGTELINNFRGQIRNIGIGLFDGIDDPHDPALGYQSVDGYIYYPMDKYDGGIDSWLKKTGRMARQIMPEIPGQISLDQKSKIIEIVFETLVLPFHKN